MKNKIIMCVYFDDFLDNILSISMFTGSLIIRRHNTPSPHTPIKNISINYILNVCVELEFHLNPLQYLVDYNGRQNNLT